MLEKIKERYTYSAILLRELVITDFKLRYQSSILGYVWSLLRPLALFIILYFVFVKFLRVGESIEHFPVYLLLGIVIWNYFSEVTNNGVSAIVSRGDLLRKLNFPKYVIILAGSFSALINLGLNFLVVIMFAVYNDVSLMSSIIWLPVLVIELFIFSLSMAFLLGALFVKIRDVNYIWEVIMQGAFYATPILYPISIIPELAQKILILNPMAQIIQDIRYVAITHESATIGTVYGNEWMRLVPLGIVALITVVAITYFRAQSKHFAEEV
ncbi:MAG TPA: ABC transporter permease [Candidatus Saccharibacteria bacterium]|nr:ABC transporter permease [Candidatus Saccharibacteria bacterium]